MTTTTPARTTLPVSDSPVNSSELLSRLHDVMHLALVAKFGPGGPEDKEVTYTSYRLIRAIRDLAGGDLDGLTAAFSELNYYCNQHGLHASESLIGELDAIQADYEADHQSRLPRVGGGATMCGWSDRHPYTVVEVSKSGKTAWVIRDEAVVTSGTTMDGSAKYAYYSGGPDLPERRVKVTKRKNGWAVAGGSSRVYFGYRSEYHDPTF